MSNTKRKKKVVEIEKEMYVETHMSNLLKSNTYIQNILTHHLSDMNTTTQSFKIYTSSLNNVFHIHSSLLSLVNQTMKYCIFVDIPRTTVLKYIIVAKTKCIK